MGMFKYKESSSDDEENGEKDKEKDDGRKRTESERSNAGEQPKKDLEEEIKFGERLQDDLINSFSDKLQAAYPRDIEGLFAIQFLLITDMADVRKQLTGRNPAVQVLFDKTRQHYILVHYNPRYHFIEIYDSLQTFDTNGKPTIIREICIQISNMFGHLFRRDIPCLIDKEYELQSDNFSCGYRVIGALVDIARDKNPAKFKYSRNAILDFLKLVLNTSKPKWELFEQAKFGRHKSYSGNQCVKLYIPNLSYSNSTSSSRVSSVDSLASFNSQSSTDSQITSRKNGGRDQLEWKQGPVRMAKLPVFPEPETSVKRDVTSPKPNEDDGTLMGYFRHGYQSVADFFHRKTVGEEDQLVAEKKE